MRISVYNIINSKSAVNLTSGSKFYDALKQQDLENLTIDFTNIEYISSMFLNESIGRLALVNSSIKHVTFYFPTEEKLNLHRVNDVIENALMGESYDELIEEANLSL